MSTSRDSHWMARAIELSRRGFPAPNPRVGCVLVRDGQLIGEGWHEYAGGAHAEAAAVAAAGECRGATAFVTLEPCNHVGRTPPCSQLLIEAGISEVVVACPDPNPVARGGADTLRAAGIKVRMGTLARASAEINERFLAAMRLRRPFVLLKAAMTVDAKVAREDGRSKWITGERTRLEGRRLRAELGCVLVGARTVVCDDPQLTARIDGVRNEPLRVILDPDRLLSGAEKVFHQPGKTLHVVRQELASGGRLGVQAREGGFDLGELLARLMAEHRVTGILVEGGPTTAARFIRAGLADGLELFIAPKLFGAGLPWPDPKLMAGFEPPLLALRNVRRIDGDLHLSYRISGLEGT